MSQRHLHELKKSLLQRVDPGTGHPSLTRSLTAHKNTVTNQQLSLNRYFTRVICCSEYSQKGLHRKSSRAWRAGCPRIGINWNLTPINHTQHHLTVQMRPGIQKPGGAATPGQTRHIPQSLAHEPSLGAAQPGHHHCRRRAKHCGFYHPPSVRVAGAYYCDVQGDVYIKGFWITSPSISRPLCMSSVSSMGAPDKRAQATMFAS